MEKSAILVPLVTARSFCTISRPVTIGRKKITRTTLRPLNSALRRMAANRENTSMTGALTRMRAFSSTNTRRNCCPCELSSVRNSAM